MFLLVVGDAFASVRFTLIPNRSTHGKWSEGMDHGVVDGRRGSASDFGVLGVGFDLFHEVGKFGDGLETVEGRPWLDAGSAPV